MLQFDVIIQLTFLVRSELITDTKRMFMQETKKLAFASYHCHNTIRKFICPFLRQVSRSHLHNIIQPSNQN